MSDSTNQKYLQRDFDALWTKSEAELKVTMSQAARTLLTQNVGYSEESDNKRKYAAAEAVLAEKERRKKEEDSIKKIYEQKVEKAFLNLKAAHTPNGQLVVAILEEEKSLTEDELHNWCEELQAISEEEFHSLLQDLVDDGVIYQPEVSDGKYEILRICLKAKSFNYPYDYKSWVEKVLALKYPDKNFEKSLKNMKYTLSELDYMHAVFYPEDFFSSLEFMAKSGDMQEIKYLGYDNFAITSAVEDKDSTLVYQMVRDHLDRLHKWGVLSSINGGYYLPLLGERPE